MFACSGHLPGSSLSTGNSCDTCGSASPTIWWSLVQRDGHTTRAWPLECLGWVLRVWLSRDIHSPPTKARGRAWTRERLPLTSQHGHVGLEFPVAVSLARYVKRDCECSQHSERNRAERWKQWKILIALFNLVDSAFLKPGISTLGCSGSARQQISFVARLFWVSFILFVTKIPV